MPRPLGPGCPGRCPGPGAAEAAKAGAEATKEMKPKARQIYLGSLLQHMTDSYALRLLQKGFRILLIFQGG